MTRHELQEKLLLYRPGDPQTLDPETQAALSEAKADPELGAWLERHTAFQRTMSAHVNSIPVPAGLKDRILTAAAAPRQAAPADNVVPFPRRSFLLWGLAAGIAVTAGLATWSLRRSDSEGFAAYRDRMARTVLRSYRMTMVSRSQPEIRKYLQEHSPHGDYSVSPMLQQLAGQGCLLMTWQGRPVSMVCLENSARQSLWLFVANRSDIPEPPPAKPVYEQVSKVGTYSWTAGEKVYVLAALGGAESLTPYL